MTTNEDLLPCPFCDGQPSYSEAEWKDESRYVGMTLECCVTMSKGIRWQLARSMTPNQHTVELQRKLAESWNNRPQAQADARDADTFEQRMSDWQHADALDAERYRWLRSRDLETISQGGVFAGMTPQNIILNEEDLDEAVDAAIAAQTSQQTMIVQS